MVLAISICIIFIYLLALHQTRLRLISLILLSTLTPIILVLQSRAGLGVLIRRIIHPDLNGHFTAALSQSNPFTLLSHYPNLVQAFYMHAHGHPPGTTLIYQTLIRLSADQTQAVFLILAFTLITQIATSILMYQTLKSYTKSAYGISLLWVLTPAVNLFIPLPDLLYSFLSLLFLYLLINRHFLLAGTTFYLSLFFSLSTLPALLLFFCLSLFSPSTYSLLPLTRIHLRSLMLGFFLPFLFFSLLDYNFGATLYVVLHTQTARSYGLWLLPNLLDFMIYSGLPLWFFLFATFKRLKTKIPLLLLISTLTLLTLSGFSRSEAGRIWLPLMPALFICLGTLPQMSSRITSLLILLLSTHTILLNLFWVSLW